MKHCGDRVHDRADDRVGIQHAGLERGDWERIEEQPDLFRDDRRWHWVNGADFPGHFGDDAGDGGDAVGTERADGLQVRLRACACAVVGTGDGEDDGKVHALGDAEPFLILILALILLESAMREGGE